MICFPLHLSSDRLGSGSIYAQTKTRKKKEEKEMQLIIDAFTDILDIIKPRSGRATLPIGLP